MNPDVGPAQWGFFLDVDGTLLTMRTHPDSVQLEPAVREALGSIISWNGGALALISGRSPSDLDRIFGPLKLPATGLHDPERRRSDGSLVYSNLALALDYTRTALKTFAARHDVTDEDGFDLVNQRGGLSIRVGEGESPQGKSAARYRVPDETAVADWLARLQHTLTLQTSASQ